MSKQTKQAKAAEIITFTSVLSTSKPATPAKANTLVFVVVSL